MSENRKDSSCFHENYVEHFRKTQRQVTKKKKVSLTSMRLGRKSIEIQKHSVLRFHRKFKFSPPLRKSKQKTW